MESSSEMENDANEGWIPRWSYPIYCHFLLVSFVDLLYTCILHLVKLIRCITMVQGAEPT